MTDKDERLYIQDILAEISNLEQFVSPFSTWQEFSKNRQAVYACARSLEILGEAAKKIPKELKDKHPAIEWKEMIGMRDKLIHDYGNTRSDVIWSTVKEDLPKLKEQLGKLLGILDA